MPNFDIVKKSKVSNSYKAAKIRGLFDLQAEEIIEHFKGEIVLPDQWQIGVIVGPSGTGKTTIAKELFNESFYTKPEFKSISVIDDMQGTPEQIAQTFNSVGFSSPPSWLKPYDVLSNGEKMRVELADAILSDNPLIVFDEYTSVVDRNVAQIGSAAIKKAISRTDKQFVAVACHYDILDWLEPDWVFDTKDMTMQKKNSKDQKSTWKSDKSRVIGRSLANITI